MYWADYLGFIIGKGNPEKYLEKKRELELRDNWRNCESVWRVFEVF